MFKRFGTNYVLNLQFTTVFLLLVGTGNVYTHTRARAHVVSTDLYKGFIQGIIATSTNCHSDELTIPNRYITALKSLSSIHIVISPSDKDGGVVIIDSTVYYQKLMDLTTNEQISLQTVSNNIYDFNTSNRKLITNEDKSWSSLINYHPIIPKIYGLPKTHKPDIPQRPIISGIEPHPIISLDF